MIRDLILTVTILGIIYTAANQPAPPVRPADMAPICVVDRRVAVKHPVSGEWLFGWSQAFDVCSKQDKFFEI